MVVCSGGMLDKNSLLDSHILRAVGCPPSNARKLKMEDILEVQGIPSSFEKRIKQRADRMVRKKFLNYSRDGTYVFSRDSDGKYGWREATVGDRVMNAVGQYFS